VGLEAIFDKRVPEVLLFAGESREIGKMVHDARRKMRFNQGQQPGSNAGALASEIKVGRILAPGLP
jgi:hypothetical protein